LGKAKLKNVEADAAVVSVTPYDELSKVVRKENGDPEDRDQFTAKRVFFQDRNGSYDYMALLLQKT